MTAIARMSNVRQFSEKRLRCGAIRTIAALSGRGRPALAVTFFDRGRVLTRTLFHAGDDVRVLERAIEQARDPNLHGRSDAGTLQHGDVELAVMAWPDAIGFARSVGGRDLGRATILAGRELAALAEAVAFVRGLGVKNDAAIVPQKEV